jgi:NAD(P)-dependent dehydrogenase (short-subunit alcohol dehydrogenase family)
VDRLRDKVVVVTGASSGFGRGIAQGVRRAGGEGRGQRRAREPHPGGFEEDAGLTTAEAIEKNGGRAVSGE